jgi:hypothetical protein
MNSPLYGVRSNARANPADHPRSGSRGKSRTTMLRGRSAMPGLSPDSDILSARWSLDSGLRLHWQRLLPPSQSSRIDDERTPRVSLKPIRSPRICWRKRAACDSFPLFPPPQGERRSLVLTSPWGISGSPLGPRNDSGRRRTRWIRGAASRRPSKLAHRRRLAVLQARNLDLDRQVACADQADTGFITAVPLPSSSAAFARAVPPQSPPTARRAATRTRDSRRRE